MNKWIPCSDCNGGGQHDPFLAAYISPMKFPKPCYTCEGSGHVPNPEWPVEVTVDNFTHLVAGFSADLDNTNYTLRVKADLRDGVTFGVVIARDLVDKTGEPLQVFLMRELNDWFLSKGQSETHRSLLLHGPSALPGFASYPSASWHAPTQNVGAPSGSQIVRELRRLLPELDKRVQCPVTVITEAGTERCVESNSVYNTVTHLNDQHRWTREAIADWLETLDVDITFPSDPDSMPAPPEPKKKKGCGCSLCQAGLTGTADPVTFQYVKAPPLTFGKPANDVVFIDDPVIDEIAAWGATSPLITEKSILDNFTKEMAKLKAEAATVLAVQKPPLILPPWLAGTLAKAQYDLAGAGWIEVNFAAMPPEPAPKEKALQAKKEHAAKQQKLLENLAKTKKGKGVK